MFWSLYLATRHQEARSPEDWRPDHFFRQAILLNMNQPSKSNMRRVGEPNTRRCCNTLVTCYLSYQESGKGSMASIVLQFPEVLQLLIPLLSFRFK